MQIQDRLYKGRRKDFAFTLIELSIVLVIVALVAGGIVVGRDMIRQAAVGRLLIDADKYKTAIHLFKIKYHAIPGDMSTATNFWPSTTNGDGDGLIGEDESEGAGNFERFRSWQHLSLSGAIDTIYTGVWGGAGNVYRLGVNAPKSSIQNVGYRLFHWSIDELVYNRTDNGMMIASLRTNNNHLEGGVLTPREAFALETKSDDGQPDSGKLYVFRGADVQSDNVCVDGYVDDESVEWRFTDITYSCRLYFWLH
jgi:prepilin-type N-terminal cleavage/methylation domain-containing protein